MAQSPTADPTAARLDARLVPAALTSWMVTAVGIVWPIGTVVGSVCLAASASGALLWRFGPRRPAIRAIGIGLAAAGVVGAGFGFAIALRADAVAHHPIAAAFGTTVEVAVTPTQSAVSVGHSRLLFRASLRQLAGEKTSGRAVVFAPARDFGTVMVGRPMRFRARITAPTRRDLSVAVITAVGAPTMGRAGPLNRAADAVRGRVRRCGFSRAARRPGGDAAGTGAR